MPNVAIRGVIARLCLGLAEVPPDAELLGNYIATRDEAAFASLVERHGPKVFAVCRRLLGQHQLAEDAYQATFVVLAKKAHTIQPRSAVGGFLYGVARKAALEAYAVSRRRKETLVETVPDSPAAPLASPESDVLAMLDEEIANLSDTYRAAVVLCELDGVGRADAALQLGIAEGTLSSRLAAARKQLATRLKARGVVYSAGLMSSLAISANAAIPPTIATATTAVSLIATGVLRTMLLAKFKLVTTVCVLVTAIIGMSTFVPKTSMEAKAAPVPKMEKDEGLIWTQDAKTGTLTAFTIDGKKEHEIKLKAGRNFHGFSADGETLLFLAKKGQLTEEEDGLTLHLGKPSDLAGAIDTGIEYQANDGYLLTRDNKRIVRHELTQVGIVLNQNDKPNAEEKPMLYRHTIIDLASKKVTAIELPDSVQIHSETVDGKEWIAMHYNLASDRKLPGYRHLRIPVNGGKPIPICDTHQLPFFASSPDGHSYLGIGVPIPIKEDLKGFSLYHLNATGKPNQIEQFEGTDQWNLRWSPDGKRFAIKKHGNADVIVADINGKNRKTLLTIPDAGPETHMIGWFAAAKQKIVAPVPKVAKDEGLLWMLDPENGRLIAYTSGGQEARTVTVCERKIHPTHFLGLSRDGQRAMILAKSGVIPDAEAYPTVTEELTVHLLPLFEPGKLVDTGIEFGVSKLLMSDTFTTSVNGEYIYRCREVAEAGAKRGMWTVTRFDRNGKNPKEIALPDHMRMTAVLPDENFLLQEFRVTNSHKYLAYHFIPGGEPVLVSGEIDVESPSFSPDGKTLLATAVHTASTAPPDGITRKLIVIPRITKTVARIDDKTNACYVEGFWSPDGKHVAMVWYDSVEYKRPLGMQGELRCGKGEILVCNSDGSDPKRVMKLPDVGNVGPAANDLRHRKHLLGWFPTMTQPIIAPVPKVEKDEGLIWTQDAKTGTLTAFTLDGKKEREIKLKAGRNFQGFSADGETLLFFARKGQLTDEEDGLTLHLGKPGDIAGAIDTGIERSAKDHFYFLLTRDKKRVVRVQHARNGPNPPVNRVLPSFTHTLIDLATKKETANELTEHMQIWDETHDGKEWIVEEYNSGEDLKRPGNRYLRIPMNGGKPIPICDTHQFPYFFPSPDGQTYLGLGVSLPPGKDPKGFNLYHFNPATGKATELEQFADTKHRNLHWSPDGKRFVIQNHGDADVIVTDINGMNRKTLLTIPDAGPETQMIGWFAAKQKIAAPVPKVEFPKQPISAPVPKEREEVIVAYHAGRPVLLNENGKVVRELFAEGWSGSTGRAMISPNGRQIAMLTDTKRDPTGWMFRKLYLRDIDGKGNGDELMPEGLEALTAMWSPDGKSIFTSGFVTKKTIVDGKKNPNYANEAGIHHRIDIASKKRTELTLPAGHQIMDISPDGKWFLTHVPHTHNARETYKVCLVDMDGKVMDDLTDGSAPIVGLRFSPDGKKVVASRYNDVDNRTAVRLSEVFILDVAAKEKMVVLPLNGLHNDAIVQSVAWSPDGNRIAFSWWTDGRTKGEPKDTFSHVSIATLDDAKIRTIFSVKDKTLGSIDWAK